MAYTNRENASAKDSPKVAATKKKLKDAFITLYAEQPIEKISIKAITDLAGFNRGTFYTYYLDVYDLLAQIENDLYDYIIINIRYFIQTLIYEEDLDETLIVNFFKANPTYIKVLLATPGKSELREKVKGKIKGILRRVLANRKVLQEPQDQQRREYLLEYITSAHLGVINYWFTNDLDMPAMEVFSFLKANLNKICR